MKVYSIFKSISGECGGPIKQGEWCVFLRLSGCSLRCSYCDSVYAQEIDSGTEMTPEQVFEEIEQLVTPGRQVLITGGEPLLQQDELVKLCKLLHDASYTISIETNGSILPKRELILYVDWFVFDYKTPSSWMNDKMMDFEEIKYRSTVKFVCANEEDLESVYNFIVKHGTRYFQYWISPCMNSPFSSESNKKWKLSPDDIMKWLVKNDLLFVGINTQLHKLLKFEESL
jgi:7-carboxy-7-deazaguanine synthase